MVGLSPSIYATYLVVVDAALALVYASVAAVLVWRRATDRMALFSAFALLLFGGVTFPENISNFPHDHPLLVASESVLSFAGATCFALFLFVFPNGRFVPGWTRWVALPWAFVQALNTVIPQTSEFRATFVQIQGPVFLVGTASAFFAQVYRYRRVSGSVQRQQTKWTVYGFSIALLGYVGLNALASEFVASAQDPLLSLGYYTGLSAFMTVLPLSIGVAILRHRLYDIDLLINRTVVYIGLTASVVGVYVVVVGYVGAVFHARGDLLSLLGAGTVAVLFQPLRQRLQRAVNHLLYGQRDEPYAVLSQLRQRLEGALAPEAVLPTIVQTVRDALKLPYAAIALGADEAFGIAAASGTPVPDPVRLPLTYRGERLGHLLLAPRAAGEAFAPADRRLLDDLAHQAGIAAHAVRLTEDLQHSRERLVATREEERRRLRRDLHDGLGPMLAAQTLKVGAARALLPPEATAADRLLDELEDDLANSLADIRRLVYNLRPPALDELGLVGAIRECAAQYSAHDGSGPTGVRISVAAPERLPALPAAVEVAAYRIVQEALANVVRHAHAHTCRVELSLDAALHVSIADDGLGLPSERRAGVGLTSMRERAEELGGTCIVEPAPIAGSRVLAHLPLAPAHELLRGGGEP
jgi:signal transduction histidine kinase